MPRILNSSKAEVTDLLKIVDASDGRIRIRQAARELEEMGYSERVAKNIISDALKVADLSEKAGWLNYDDKTMKNTPPYLSPEDIQGPDPDAMWYNAAQQYAQDLTYTRKSSRDRKIAAIKDRIRERRMARQASEDRPAYRQRRAAEMPEAMAIEYGKGKMKTPVAKYSDDMADEDYPYMKYFQKQKGLLPPQRNVHNYGVDLQNNKIKDMTTLASRRASRNAERERLAHRAAIRARIRRRADYADQFSNAPKGCIADDDYAMRASDMPVPTSVQEVARDLAKRNAERRQAMRRRALINRRRSE